jgi:5,5'-dehydrodivanillate O-demethylase
MVEITPLPCNWLQCMDNSFDPIHYEHLHGVYGNYVAKKEGRPPRMRVARHLKIDFDVFEFGVYKRRLIEGEPEDCDDWTRGHPVLFPNTLLVGDATAARYQIRVPADDTHTIHYNYNVWPKMDGEDRWQGVPVEHSTIYEESGDVIANTVFKQDALGWVGQGPISDRTTEHLVTSDRGIVLYHNLLLANIETALRGDDPMGVVRDRSRNEPYIAIKWEDRAKEAFWPGGRDGEWRDAGALGARK